MRSADDSVVFEIEPTHTRTLTIPFPESFPKATGISSTDRWSGSMRMRCSDADYALIAAEAAHVNMSMSMFIRWCALFAARAVRQERTGERVAITP